MRGNIPWNDYLKQFHMVEKSHTNKESARKIGKRALICQNLEISWQSFDNQAVTLVED